MVWVHKWVIYNGLLHVSIQNLTACVQSVQSAIDVELSESTEAQTEALCVSEQEEEGEVVERYHAQLNTNSEWRTLLSLVPSF